MFEEKEVKTIGQYFNGKVIFSFIAGIVVGVLFAVPLVERGKWGTDFFASVFEPKEKTSDLLEEGRAASSAADGTETVVVSGESLLVVGDQPAGLTAVMSMVLLSQSGWVAIHEETPEGAFGNILGARRFPEGKYFGSSIELLRATEGDGKVYYAVLHADDGDNVFNFQIEKPVEDESGRSVSARFTTTL